jgi:hypothetical protein
MLIEYEICMIFFIKKLQITQILEFLDDSVQGGLRVKGGPSIF